ncbi:MAG: hypothetical protein H6719_16655 [Sandaracinaceae bacterium]|nr:hypothetical protein [Sandaracinaceae bacterium]
MSDLPRRGKAVFSLLLACLAGCSGSVAVDAGPGAGLDASVDASVDASFDAATIDDAGAPPTCEVLAALAPERLMAPAAGSDGYRVPSAQQLQDLTSAVVLAQRRAPSALGAAELAGYRLCVGEGAEDGLSLLEPRALDAGHARVVLRTAGAPLVFEAPHPGYDTRTLEESVALFTALEASALLVSGTHRCASALPSGCDGTTGACGATAPYVVSDVAHAVDSFFHAAHVGLALAFEDAVFVSVHGFADDGASVSDGTNDPIALDAPAARLARAMSARFDGITACSDGAGVPFEERLCGTTNVQGRQLAGVANECDDAAPAASGRFIHMEQSRLVRDDAATVVEAFREAFP